MSSLFYDGGIFQFLLKVYASGAQPVLTARRSVTSDFGKNYKGFSYIILIYLLTYSMVQSPS